MDALTSGRRSLGAMIIVVFLCCLCPGSMSVLICCRVENVQIQIAVVVLVENKTFGCWKVKVGCDRGSASPSEAVFGCWKVKAGRDRGGASRLEAVFVYGSPACVIDGYLRVSNVQCDLEASFFLSMILLYTLFSAQSP